MWQTIVELFLGLRLPSYFPSARLPFTDTLPLDEDSDAAESDTEEPFVSAARSQVHLLPFPFLHSLHGIGFFAFIWVQLHGLLYGRLLAWECLAQLCLRCCVWGVQQGWSPDLVNQHTLLEASRDAPVEEAPAPSPWQQIGQEPGHILDQLTLSDVQQATQPVLPTTKGDLPVTAVGSGAQMKDMQM